MTYKIKPESMLAPHIQRGRRSEKIVGDYLVSQGKENVRIIGGSGKPDVEFTETGRQVLVEVKTIFVASHPYRRKPPIWWVAKVGKSRIHDDFVAAVTPNDGILWFSMAEHLKKCSPCGIRFLTKYAAQLFRAAHNKQSFVNGRGQLWGFEVTGVRENLCGVPAKPGEFGAYAL